MNQLEVINIADMYPTKESMDKLYMYEITNRDLSTLQIEESSINFFELGNEKIIYGHFSSNVVSMNVTTPSDDQIVRAAEVNYKTSLQFVTNDDLVESSNLHRYVFTKKQFTKDDIKENVQRQFFILGNDNAVIFTPVNNEKMWTLNFIEFKSLEVFKNSRSVFISKNDNTFQNFQKAIISFDNSSLINSLNLFGIWTNNSNELKKIRIPISDTSNFFINFLCNPIEVENNNLRIYTPWFNKNYTLLLGEILKNINVNNSIRITDILNKEAESLIFDLLHVTTTLLSGYSNLSNGGQMDETIKKFKNEVYNGTDPKDYCDFKIDNYLNTETNEDKKRIFKNIILGSSQYLSSKYCWKNGLTSEHKLGLPFYIDWIPKDGDINGLEKVALLKSSFYDLKINNSIPDIDWKAKGYLFENIFNIDFNVVTMPKIPKIVESQNISNTPLDFNENSYNFNYQTYMFFNSKKYINLLLGNYLIDDDNETKVSYNSQLSLSSVSRGNKGYFFTASWESDIYPDNNKVRALKINFWIHKWNDKGDGNSIIKTYTYYHPLPGNSALLDDYIKAAAQGVTIEIPDDYLSELKEEISKLINLDSFFRKNNLSIGSNSRYSNFKIKNIFFKWAYRPALKNNTSGVMDIYPNLEGDYLVPVKITKQNELNFVFNYYEWKNFLEKNNYLEKIELSLIPSLLNGKIKKVEKMILSGFFVKDLSIKLFFENSDEPLIYKIEAFDKSNESYTQTIINF
ncbi:hypothetical protein [[Mycoplasma] testudinis]|uniref:hypothetical protein n=1 Tax=[Mycoplasma] testudinis TaxID=33924 RepID=UPI00048115A7|nr:hypothetical protein [[Mycoplasma] testudinis]